jgi:hypothetical protein
MKEMLTISALIAFGLCVLFKVIAMVSRQGQGSKTCDACCAALFWLGLVFLACANLTDESYSYPNWAEGVGVGNAWHRSGPTKLQLTQRKHHHKQQAKMAAFASTQEPCDWPSTVTSLSSCRS